VFWNAKAKATMNAIIPTTDIHKGGNYDVVATIKNRQGDVLGKGAYNPLTGVHAEIDALSGCPLSKLATISVSPAPCKRCAVILAYYIEKHDWSVSAPTNKFASTNAGAYGLPDHLKKDVVVEWLVQANIINPAEAVTHGVRIVSYFMGAAWCV
jgi:hypothetical protein